MRKLLQMFEFLASWYARLWEIMASIRDLGRLPGWLNHHGIPVLIVGAAVVLVMRSVLGPRHPLKWLKSAEDVEVAYELVVRTAKREIVSVGSNSRCPVVLDGIGRAMDSTRGLIHTRILTEAPDPNVREYLCKLLKKRPNPANGADPTLRIGVCRPEDVGNVQVCANETIAVFVFDLGLLFNGDSFCLQVRNKYLCRHVVKFVWMFYETHARKVKSCTQLSQIPAPIVHRNRSVVSCRQGVS